MTAAVAGICWPHGGTVGVLTVTTPLIRGVFSQAHGHDGIACCEISPAGKYRNGAARSWCRIHQQYWGTKADLATGEPTRCARHADPVHYARDPLVLDLAEHGPTVITLTEQGIAVESANLARLCVPALALRHDPASTLFPATGIVQINLTPPAIAALTQADGCVCCAKCGHPHLDLGDFALRPHKRHYCGHCGNDSTHGKQPGISNPLHALLRHTPHLQIGISIVHGNNML